MMKTGSRELSSKLLPTRPNTHIPELWPCPHWREQYEAAGLGACQESLSSRAQACTSPFSNQSTELLFAFEPLSLILLAQVIPGRRPPPGDANHPFCPGGSSNSREEAPEPQPPVKQPGATDSPWVCMWTSFWSEASLPEQNPSVTRDTLATAVSLNVRGHLPTGKRHRYLHFKENMTYDHYSLIIWAKYLKLSDALCFQKVRQKVVAQG